jgi:hypothetical protein
MKFKILRACGTIAKLSLKGGKTFATTSAAQLIIAVVLLALVVLSVVWSKRGGKDIDITATVETKKQSSA